MENYIIRNLPAFTDHKGNEYPQRYGLSLKCSRGLAWDGGEFLTRDDAVNAGKTATKR